MSEDISVVQERLAQRKRQIEDLRRRDTKEHYLSEFAEAKARGMKVAWSPAGLVVELLDALDIKSCAPEQYTAICASKQLAGKFCQTADSHGISPDVCSYGRAIMGMMWDNDGPFGAMPDPDLVILDSAYCDAHAKMWDIPAQHFGIPSIHLDGSFHMSGSIGDRDVDYKVSELKRLVRFCEEQFGLKFDYERFKENMRIEGQVRTLFNEIQELRKSRPCPRSTRDMVGDLFHIVTMPHTQKAVEYYELVAEDCRERVRHGIGVLDNERFRVYWDNIPLWFWLGFFDYLQERGVVFASDSYSNTMFNGYYAIGGRFDPDKPFESLALRMLYIQGCFGVPSILDRYAWLIGEWQCDGAVLFSNNSCKVFTSGNLDKANMIKNRLRIPILEFEGNMADPTSIDKADVLGRANLFLEQLEANAAAGRRGA